MKPPVPTFLRGDARNLPLPDESVDLIVTSPPYWSLRSYTDGGEHYEGQIGAEPTPSEYLDSLIECTREWMRVLKPTGSCFINLGDVYSTGLRFDNELTVEDAAWLGGVIDSDGSISIRADNSGRSHVTWVRVGQMRREVVERIGSITGTGQVWQDKRGVWNWNAAAQQAKWVLERIWPWLRIKRRQALAGVELMDTKAKRGAKGRWNRLTDADIAHRERIRQAVLAWNRGDPDDYKPALLALPNLPKDARWIQPKSLLLLPERYAVRCVDELGLIARAEIIWSKPNGLPESVTDRVRRSHEVFFHFTKERRYFSAVDEIREQYEAKAQRRFAPQMRDRGEQPDRSSPRQSSSLSDLPRSGVNPLGKLPDSVWEIPTQPLKVPAELGVDHFAAFPMEWPRRLILGWSPREACTACGEGRRPIVNANTTGHDNNDAPGRPRSTVGLRGDDFRSWRAENPRTISGYACTCPDTTAPSTPGVVLDPFSGTGTTALVASMLGRRGIGVELSADYIRLAQWRASDPKERARAAGLDPDQVAAIKPELPGQVDLLELLDGEAS